MVRHGKVRRAKLYYLRDRRGKAARIAERRVDRVAPTVDAAANNTNVSTETGAA